MTNKTLLSHVIAHAEEYGYSTDDEGDLYETFIECLSEDIVQDTVSSRHRWYDIHDYVHKVTIDNMTRYFRTEGYYMTEDSCAEDMDLEMPKLSDVVEVYPREVVQVIYE